jgi:hypothetical protein
MKDYLTPRQSNWINQVKTFILLPPQTKETGAIFRLRLFQPHTN